jgi:hypothetical protein
MVPAELGVLSAPDEGAHDRAPQLSQDLVAIDVLENFGIE